jgi:hypothetical protein
LQLGFVEEAFLSSGGKLKILKNSELAEDIVEIKGTILNLTFNGGL